MVNPEPQDGVTEESWAEARKIAGLVSNVSALFSTAIRFLRKDTEAKLPSMSQSSRYAVQRLLNSESFKAPVYYAALTFKPEAVHNAPHLTPRALAELLSPVELANMIGLLYLYRRIQKGCDPTEWSELTKLIHLHGEMGGHLGVAMKNIGLGHGLLLGTIRHLSMGLFLGMDKKAFTQYRRGMKIAKRDFDLDLERKNWGCTHLEVASILIQSLGLGGEHSKAITSGLLLTGIPDKQLDIDSYRMRIGWAWIRSLIETGAPPNITHRGDFYPLKAELERLTSTAERVINGISTHHFFAKGKEDISPSLTPKLYEGVTPEAHPEEIPSEVARELGDANLELEEL